MSVKTYSIKRGGNIHLSPHFTVKEFACHDGSDVIFMSAPPASASNESQSGIHFHMNDVDDVIAKFAADNNMEYLSLYKKTLDYMEKTGATLDDLLVDGLHPNDRLHTLMYGWILEGLGLSRKIDGATW